MVDENENNVEHSYTPYEPRTPIEWRRVAQTNSDYNYIDAHYTGMGANFARVDNLLHYPSEKPADSFKKGDLVVKKGKYTDIHRAVVWAVVGKYTRSYVYIIRIPRSPRTGEPATLEDHMERLAFIRRHRARNEGRGGGRKSMKNRRGLKKNHLTHRR